MAWGDWINGSAVETPKWKWESQFFLAVTDMANPHKESAIADIQVHLESVGARNWEALRTKYPVPDSTWFRWLREAKVGMSGRGERRGQEKAVPPPQASSAVISPTKGRVKIDLIYEVGLLLDDAHALRKHSIGNDGQIRLPKIFSKSIDHRHTALTMFLKTAEYVADIRKLQKFHELIIEEVAKESPDVVNRVMQRLFQLSREIGVTHRDLEL